MKKSTTVIIILVIVFIVFIVLIGLAHHVDMHALHTWVHGK
jgi:amino acid transporter